MPSAVRCACLGIVLSLALTGCDNPVSQDQVFHPPQPPPPPPLPDIPAQELAWLNAVVVPFSGDDPSADDADLEPLRAMIGNARMVALGEGTHGTRQFFRMKERIVRFLVSKMGFNAFAIEATWPEANRLDTYVRTGVGAPDTLLSGLYFWTWNTSEVLNLIQWLRGYNATGGASVGFYGFDMQFPGMAIENVRRFVRKVDAPADVEFAQLFGCLASYSNNARGFFGARYASESQSYRDQCHGSLDSAKAMLEERQQAYEAASSPAEFARAVHSARVALQYEEMASLRNSRDAAMAENALWLLHQLGPDGKIVLWAHNFHVSTLPGAMGRTLRDSLASDLVILGFTFANGSFNAVRRSSGTLVGLQAVTAARPEAWSYEHYFLASGQAQFMVDLRNRSFSTDSSVWFAGPRRLRTIGAVYDPDDDAQFGYPSHLPVEFDIMTYFATSTPTAILPFNPPNSF